MTRPPRAFHVHAASLLGFLEEQSRAASTSTGDLLPADCRPGTAAPTRGGGNPYRPRSNGRLSQTSTWWSRNLNAILTWTADSGIVFGGSNMTALLVARCDGTRDRSACAANTYLESCDNYRLRVVRGRTSRVTGPHKGETARTPHLSRLPAAAVQKKVGGQNGVGVGDQTRAGGSRHSGAASSATSAPTGWTRRHPWPSCAVRCPAPLLPFVLSGLPSEHGPIMRASWMIYGHFAVAVFIVLSGSRLPSRLLAPDGGWTARAGSSTGALGASCPRIGRRSR